jgi:hypothetical protein
MLELTGARLHVALFELENLGEQSLGQAMPADDFLCPSLPLVQEGHLTSMKRDPAIALHFRKQTFGLFIFYYLKEFLHADLPHLSHRPQEL